MLHARELHLERREETVEQIADVAVDLVSFHFAQHANRHVFLHAGVVAVDAYALVLPASTHNGKSTLVRALLERGATYLSDEFAPIDECGAVAPFARPLSLRNPGGPPTTIRADAFGASSATEPVPIGAVFLTSFDPSGAWGPRRVDPAEAVLLMTAHAIAARSAPDRVLRTLKAVATRVPVVQSPRPDVDSAADAILGMFREILDRAH